MDFERVFEKLGRFNFNNRTIVILGALTLTLVFSLGVLNARFETDPEQLWVSHQSIGYQQQSNFDNQYGAFFRTEQIILAQDVEGVKNIFTKEHLYGMYFLINLINKKSVVVNNRNVSIENLCFRPIGGKGCYRPSPLDLWKMNVTDIHGDNDIQYTALCIDSRSQTSRIPCSDENEIPIIKQSIYGGITCDQEKDKKSQKIIPCEHCWIQAKALMATYLLNKDQYTRQSSQLWEKYVLLDSIHKYNADNGSFVEQYSKYFKVSPNGQVEFQQGLKLNMYDYMPSKLGTHFEILSERSIPDELQNETNENFWIVVISYSVMFVYIGVAIGQFPSVITSGFSLAVVGIIIVLASVLSSIGLMTYLNLGLTMISAEVIPFLILAIGVDNMFIIKNAIERQKEFKLEDRVALGLKEVCPSITTAAICEALAFIVGSLTKMPALQSFCLQAAVAIIFNYIYQITAFVVALIIDQERRTSGRFDLLCCIRTNSSLSEPRGFWRDKFQGPYSTLIMKKQCFWVCIAFSVAMLGVSCFGLTQVPVGLNEQVSMEINSDLFNYFTYEKKFIEIGPPAYIVFNNFDFTDNKTIQAIQTLSNELSKLKYIQPPVYSWFASFNNFIKQDATWTEPCGASNIKSLSYEKQLKKFLEVEITSTCCQSYGICGQQYNKDLIFNDEGKLISSRLRVMHKPLRNSDDYIRAARETRLAVDFIMNKLVEKDSNLSTYPYSLFYVYYDQYSYIRSVAIQNLLLAMAVVYLAVSITQRIKIALILCACVLVTTLNLVGVVYLTNLLVPDHGFIVEINAISVVNLITCVGLTVQFTAHICISMFKGQGSQEEKLRQTMKNTGSSVFIGIGLTKFTGVLVLVLAKSTLFRLYYFRMYLGIVLLGLFNGLVLLPAVLYRFGPRGYQKDKSSLLDSTDKQA